MKEDIEFYINEKGIACVPLKDYNDSLEEIERLHKRVKEVEEAYLRTRHQYSELESKYVIDECIIKEVREGLNLWYENRNGELDDYHFKNKMGTILDKEKV